MIVLALLVIPTLVVEQRATTPAVRQAAVVLNWTIWLAFCTDFCIRWIADRTLAYPRKAWFDVLLIAISPPVFPEPLQGFRTLRLVRVFKVVRALGVVGMGLRLAHIHFGRRKFHYILFLAGATVLFGAVGILGVEGGVNPSIGGLGDALWWAVVTVTTVGYGDVSPLTTEGRLIAVVLMITGIGVIGTFTATVASFFLAGDEESDTARLVARLDAIERKLDAILQRGQSPH